MTFDEWYEKLPYDERSALCYYDVWEGALESAIESICKAASGYEGSIEILREMIDTRGMAQVHKKNYGADTGDLQKGGEK